MQESVSQEKGSKKQSSSEKKTTDWASIAKDLIRPLAPVMVLSTYEHKEKAIS